MKSLLIFGEIYFMNIGSYDIRFYKLNNHNNYKFIKSIIEVYFYHYMECVLSPSD